MAFPVKRTISDDGMDYLCKFLEETAGQPVQVLRKMVAEAMDDPASQYKDYPRGALLALLVEHWLSWDEEPTKEA